MDTEISKLQAEIHEQEIVVEELQLAYCNEEKNNGKLYFDARHDLHTLILKLQEALEYAATDEDTE